MPDLKLVAVLSDHKDDVEMAAFHPTLDLIATASRDHNVRVFDLTGRLTASFEGHTADVIPSHGRNEHGTADLKRRRDRQALVARHRRARVRGGPRRCGDRHHRHHTDRTVYAGNDDGEIIIIADGRTNATPAHEAGIKRLVHNASTQHWSASATTGRCAS